MGNLFLQTTELIIGSDILGGLDLKEQLFPNLLTIGAQLLATFVLFMVMKKFLWKPGKKYLDTRADYMKNQIDEANKIKAESEASVGEAEAQLKKAREEAREILESSKAEGERMKQELIAEGQKRADRSILDAELEVENTYKEAKTKMEKEIVDIALTATEKLLGKKSDSKETRKELEKIVKEI